MTFSFHCYSEAHSFAGQHLMQAIRNTFICRDTQLPFEIPLALTRQFATNQRKLTEWRAALRRCRLDDQSLALDQVIDELRVFLWPPAQAASSEEVFHQHWSPGGPWSQET